MVRTCAINQCSKRFTAGSYRTFHSFPQNNELLRKWILAMNQKGFVPTKNSVLCSKHFLPSDYLDPPGYGNFKPRLKPSAVPSVFLDIKHDEQTIQNKVKRWDGKNKHTVVFQNDYSMEFEDVMGMESDEPGDLHNSEDLDDVNLHCTNNAAVKISTVTPDSLAASKSSRSLTRNHIDDTTSGSSIISLCKANGDFTDSNITNSTAITPHVVRFDHTYMAQRKRNPKTDDSPESIQEMKKKLKILNQRLRRKERKIAKMTTALNRLECGMSFLAQDYDSPVSDLEASNDSSELKKTNKHLKRVLPVHEFTVEIQNNTVLVKQLQ